MNSFDFREEIETCATIGINWNKLDNKVIMITGATGLVGSYLTEVLLKRNQLQKTHTKVIAVGRNQKALEKRFENLDGLDWMERH